MSFAHPERLWLLIALAVLLAGYVLAQRRRGTYALRFSDTALLDTVAPRRPGWRRHGLALLFLGAAAVAIMALARPTDEHEVPRERALVMLTVDISLSMGADDVEPSRLQAAQEAARQFLTDAPPGIDIGLIAFSEAPVVLAPPTTDRARLAAAIDTLELGPYTNTGDAISTSISSLQRALDGLAVAQDGAPPAVVVLLSDGEPTVGRPIESAIAEAVQADIAVATVAMGTPDGEVLVEDPDTGEMVLVDVPVDEASLMQIAEGTGGEFFATASAEELAAVYRDIGTAVGFETVDRDISDRFLAVALALFALMSLLSLAWFQRLP